jgi:prevent-host-death family protein
MIMTMIRVNIHEAKAKLSHYLDAVARGERVLICKRNQPIAELRSVEQQRTEPRPIGGETGIVIRPSFFEPMSDEFLEAFEAGSAYPSPAAPRTRIAERASAPYGARRRGKRSPG